MESLASYGSDDEMDLQSSAQVKVISENDTTQSGMEGDNYDDVQMEMSENPLNGSKAPSVQAHSLGWSGGAPPTCATIPLESGSESASKDGECLPRNSDRGSSPSSSPRSAATSNDDVSDGGNSLKPEEPETQNNPINNSDKVESQNDIVSVKEGDQTKKNLENIRGREKERDKDRGRDRDRERVRDRDRRNRRSDYRKVNIYNSTPNHSRSRDFHRRDQDRDRSVIRADRYGRSSRERRSSSRDNRRREGDRRHTEVNRRDTDRRRQRSRSRSGDKRRPGNEPDSRSSSSSRSSKSDARSKDMKAQAAGRNKGSRSRSKSAEKERSRPTGSDARKFYLEKKIDRKLNVLERMGIELKAEAKSCGGMVTPQMLVQRTMEQQAAQVKQATGVELPSYYNAAAVNPQRLVDQIQKRKLLWGAKKDDPNKAAAPQQTQNKWQGATFAQDVDGKLSAKFNRLMGIKEPGQVVAEPSVKEAGGSEIIKKQEEMFHNMESQYEVARLATHTHRGLGLGFGTFQPR